MKRLLHARQLLQLLCLLEERRHCIFVLQLSLPQGGHRLDLLGARQTLEDCWMVRACSGMVSLPQLGLPEQTLGDHWMIWGCSVMPLQGTGPLLLRSESGRKPARRGGDRPLRCRSRPGSRGSNNQLQWKVGCRCPQHMSCGR